MFIEYARIVGEKIGGVGHTITSIIQKDSNIIKESDIMTMMIIIMMMIVIIIIKTIL